MISRLAILLILLLQQRYISAQRGLLPSVVLHTNQQSGVYVEGEDIIISCILLRQQRACEAWELHTPFHYSRFFQLSVILQKVKKHQGLYFCRCISRNSNSQYEVSSESASKRITVTDPVPKPILNTNSSTNVFLLREVIIFWCGYSTQLFCNSWELYKDYAHLEAFRRQRFMPLQIQNKSDAGSYYCRCTKQVTGRDISSDNSNTLKIIVTDRISTPLLTTNHSANMFLQGDVISFRCGYDVESSCNSWELYKNDEIIPKRTSSTRHLMLHVQNKSAAGSYHCRCTENVNGRMLSSKNSNTLEITITDYKSHTLMILRICCVFVILALLAGVMTAVLYNKEKLCFAKHKRNGSTTPDATVEYEVMPDSKLKSVDHTYENITCEAKESADKASQITYATFNTEALTSQNISSTTVEEHPYLYASVNV
ncbi:uncharacterized protein LOC122790374 [Protopterus annectens]|uniref:uncharacterized protein LOC122790374 n=1 Tax=Protopterus annectens TaxID=7888 RepID=UPI001CFB2797|nr:uncharacterized protein LOC122790374 [Protopterus annectens]